MPALGILLILVAVWLLINTFTGNLQQLIANKAGWGGSSTSSSSGGINITNPPAGTGTNPGGQGNQPQGNTSAGTGVPSLTNPPVISPGSSTAPIIQPTQP